MAELKNRIVQYLVERRDKVLNGSVNCIPLPFVRFREEWPGIEQSCYYLVSGATKSAKTQLTNYIFVYNTVMWTYKHPGIISPKIFYFPLEETAEAITLRFMAFLLNYLTEGRVTISPTDLKSTDERKPLSQEILDLMNSEEFNKIMDHYESIVAFYDDKNVTGISKTMKSYAQTHGKTITKTLHVKEKDELGMIKEVERQVFDYYQPDDPDEYVIFIVDHVSLLLPERGTDLRESIAKLSEACVLLRNRYHLIPVIVQQQSTETTSLDAFKSNKIRPTVAGLGDCKYTARDCTMMIGVTNPHSFELPEYLGYDITRLKGNIRFMEIVVNRNGNANGIAPLIFKGAINRFWEAPLPNDSTGLNRVYEMLYPSLLSRAMSLITRAKQLLTKKH